MFEIECVSELRPKISLITWCSVKVCLYVVFTQMSACSAVRVILLDTNPIKLVFLVCVIVLRAINSIYFKIEQVIFIHNVLLEDMKSVQKHTSRSVRAPPATRKLRRQTLSLFLVPSALAIYRRMNFYYICR